MNNHTPPLELSHFPVMLNEVLQITSPFNGGKYIDCTFGGGGYSKEILKIPKTTITAIDRDNTIKSLAEKFEKKFPERFKFYQIKFSQIDTLSNDKVDAVIFDLGLSSIQLNDLERGFSFKSNKKLDMAMGLNKFSALDVINNLSEANLKSIIKLLGDEEDASKIAKNIVKLRQIKKITRTDELVKIIEQSKKKIFSKKINPCTKTFQALRIFVNKEISELIFGLINATKVLKKGGILGVVTFHSLEDRIVKYFFKSLSENKSISRYSPIVKQADTLFNLIQKKPITPSDEEIIENPPSRSAKFRYAIKKTDFYNFDTDIKERFKNYIEIENYGDKL